jgi:hypothetical protein
MCKYIKQTKVFSEPFHNHMESSENIEPTVTVTCTEQKRDYRLHKNKDPLNLEPSQRLNMTFMALPPLALVSKASTTSFWLNP